MNSSEVAGPPLTFRAAQTRLVFRSLDHGESCALVGMASTGKSNLVAFLCRPDVQRHYLGPGADRQAVIVVDGHSLAPDGPAAWQVYELTLHRLIQWLEHQPGSAERAGRYAAEYAGVVAGRDALLGLRLLDRVLDHVVNDLGWRVALVFDEFDAIARDCPPGVFRNLRNLRDNHKRILTFVTFSREHPARLRSDPLELEPLYELLAHNVGGLTPYEPDDAQDMLARLAAAHGLTLSEATGRALVTLSGGHAGLLRGLFHHHAETGGAPAADIVRVPHVWGECETIWRGLAEDERQVLQAVAVATPTADVDPTAPALLRLKGALVDGTDGRPAIFSPVFAAFLAARSPHASPGLVIDRRTGEAWYNGRLLHLSPLEQSLLFKLAEDPGRLYTRRELLEAMYPGEDFALAVHSDNRLDTHLSRLRDEIEGDADPPRVIVTERGRGIRLFANPG